ncbi:sulfur carrier protein ThiS [Halobacillus litoralis]|uniref:Sulfur carrier protein ThiS n=1 Tax=Halobacillus litoralis TaxID=45668 RepID=A0A845FDV7_9BACI|nr:sulfur carrier protein ThiS [Halobacillus litoralis]MYL71745.1 sulfur carrier protein ThiS [Halobacillus litoralis]
MKLRINGEWLTVPETVDTIGELLGHFQLDHRVVIVEQNETILEKESRSNHKVQDGDIIEIVQFVGGG